MSMQRDLVERARRGDRDAFTQLVKLSAPRLHGIANLILRDPDRAKDAVQDAFVAAWQGIPALRDPDAWDPWLRRLAVRSCYRLAKKSQRQTLIENDVRSAEHQLRTPDTTADVADREWVLTELGRLNIDQRSVVTLHYYLDLPMREVAEILDIPFGTAASRLHRGLEVMRAAMREHPAAAYDLATERTR
jgi:RNA polymerase sigma-70 factor (ECF subfamily)